MNRNVTRVPGGTSDPLSSSLVGNEIQNIADGVRQRRKELHLTQSDAARRANVSNTTWSKLERAEWPFSQRTLRSVCEVLEWPMGALETLRQGQWPEPQRPERAPLGDDGNELIQRIDRAIEELQAIRDIVADV